MPGLDMTENVWLDVPQSPLGADQYAVGGELWGTRARFIFQYQLITNQPPLLGKGFRFPASSFPFATPPHKMPSPTI